MTWYTYDPGPARVPEKPQSGDFSWPFSVFCLIVSLLAYIGAFILLFLGAPAIALPFLVIGLTATGLARLSGR